MTTQTRSDTAELAAKICQDPDFIQSLAALISKHSRESDGDIWDMDKIVKASEDYEAGRIKGTPWNEVFKELENV
jgi:hypothetical protein